MSYVGLSGLQMAKSGLETSGHNIANVETAGFKQFRNILSDSYAQSSGSNVEMSGVRIAAMEQMFTQGPLKLTGNNFDLAIEGKGFFTLSDDGRQVFSRSGYFRLDKDGYMVNQDGYRLQGFKAGANGEISRASRGDLRTGVHSVSGNQTSDISANINLDASDTVANPGDENWTTSFSVYDSLGAQHFLEARFKRTGSNIWQNTYVLEKQNLGDFTLKFKEDGTLNVTDSTNGGVITLSVPSLANGAAAMNVELNLSATTQYAADYAISNVEQDGYESGALNQISIGDEGFLEALYSNGERNILGQVMVATFPSEVGLKVAGNNCWAESMFSGEPVFNVSGKGGAGLVRSGVLEQSNVDVTEELLNLVMEQRNYQLNARSIKAEDSMSQTLLNQL